MRRGKNPNRFWLCLVALATLSVLAGCSGGGGSTTAPAPPPPVASPPPPPITNLTTETDVIYGSGLTTSGAVNLLLDIYQPDGPCTTPPPFVVGIHGGGFTGGKKSASAWEDNMAAVVEAGFVGLSIDYRVVGDDPVASAEFQPIANDFDALVTQLGLGDRQRAQLNAAVAAFEDTVTALEWARDNATTRCLDIDRFALWGASAGAITSLHVAHGLDEYFIDRPEPRVVIDYWGQVFQRDLIDAGGPPLMIIHGTADQTVIYQDTAVPLAAEADAVGLSYSFYTIQDGPHGFGAIDPARVSINGETALSVTINFIADHLLDGSPNYEVKTIIPN